MRSFLAVIFALTIVFVTLPARAANNSPATATPLSPDSPVTDHLDDYGSQDYFSFTLPEDGRVRLLFQHENVGNYKYWDLVVLDSTASVQLLSTSISGSGTGSTYEIGLPAGKYYVWVNMANELTTTPYTITASFPSGPAEKELNESPAAATPVVYDATYSGAFQSRGYIDQDWYRFEVPQEGNVTLTFNQALQDPNYWRVSVVDASGSVVYLRQDMAGTPAATVNQIGLRAGSYFLSVVPYSRYGVDESAFIFSPYSFRLGFTPGANFEKESNDAPETATAANLNETYSGFIQPRNSSDWDYYRFTVPSAGTLPVQLESRSLGIYDETGNKTVYYNSSTGGSVVHVPFTTPGTYLLLVTSGLNDPHYTFRIGYPDVTAPTVAKVTPEPDTLGASRSITVEFSEIIDPASVTSDSLSLNQGCTGKATLSGKVLTFTPDRPLSQAASYTATVKGTVKDLAGNPLGKDFSWTFMTSAEVGSAAVPKTGQITCYAGDGTGVTCEGTGQDAELRHGITWPDPRFAENGDGTVTDRLTGLMWVQEGNIMATRDPGFDAVDIAGDGGVNWERALAYVKKLNQERYLGYSDWRLPNLHEMESLVLDTLKEDSTFWLNSLGFKNLRPTYWTSSRKTEYWIGWNKYSWNFWLVDLKKGQRDYGYGDYNDAGLPAVLPVRSAVAGAIKLPATGISSCVNENFNSIACAGTGQDGELRKGETLPAERFRAEGGIVVDYLTGLVWSYDANLIKHRDPDFDTDGRVTWQQALDYVKKLNTNKYLGYADWRLPNRREITSLIDFGTYNSAAQLPMTGFPGDAELAGYWSSTNFGNKADALSFWDGRISRTYKDQTLYVLPVRGGEDGELTSSPSRHDFGLVAAADTSPLQVFIISNRTDRTLSFGAPQLSGPAAGSFSVTPGGLLGCDPSNNNLGPGEWCSVEVRFTPAAGGAASAELTVTLTGQSAPLLRVPLAGSSLKTTGVLTVTMAGSGGGSVNSKPSGLACVSGSCSASFAAGTPVTLMATADAQSLFAGWSGGCTGSGDCTVSMDDDRSVTAAFSYVMPVRIPVSPTRFFYGLKPAYDVLTAGQPAVIEAREVTLTENLVFSKNARVTVKGGYDRLYAARAGRTTLQGKLSVRTGTLVADHLAVR